MYDNRIVLLWGDLDRMIQIFLLVVLLIVTLPL
jgi:hypothetical protein